MVPNLSDGGVAFENPGREIRVTANNLEVADVAVHIRRQKHTKPCPHLERLGSLNPKP